MFSITTMSSGSEDYYIKRCSYYGLRPRKKKRSKGDPDDDSPDLDPDGAAPGFDSAEEHSIHLPGEPPGRWGGGAAAFFRLSGIIQEEDYRRIYHGFHPHTGEPLVQNAGKPNRRPGWECCLSALKDYSILTFAVPGKWRKRFLKVYWEVVEDVLRMIEERFAFSRVGKAKNGCRSVPVRILAALWEHCSSRSLDEDLHIHIQLFNLGVDAAGKVRALDPLLIFRNQKLITAYFQAKLAAEMKEQFGLIVEADGDTYRIQGVPKDLVKEKSKRRQEILAYMAERGLSGWKDSSQVAKITRSPKDYGISRAELMEKWRATNIAAGFDDAAIARLLRNAGVGKSYALKACFDACKRQGLRLHVLAPTGKTADDLARDTGVGCQTLTKFLGDFLLPWPVRLRHHLRQLWRAARRRKTWRFRQPHPPKLTSRDIVVVDEAGMVGTRQLRLLAELVERAGATLWLIGDPNQLPSVEGTPPLPTLAAKYGAVYLKKIRRQKKAWARQAARLFAEGHVVRALNLFLDHKHITVRDSMDELLQQVCWEWTEQGLHTPEQALIITNQNAVAHEVNQLCQEHRLNAGCLRPSPSIHITDEQEEDAYESHVYCGDRVVFTQNTQPFPKGYGVKNGSRGTVVEIHGFMGEIVVLLDKKKLVKVPVRKYPHVRLGYAVTTYKSQSSSVPYIYAIVAGTDFPASYVQSTRAIERTLFYTTSNLLNADLENIAASPLAQQMSRRPDLRLASELLADAPLKLRPQKLHLRRPHRPPHRHHNLSRYKKVDPRPRKDSFVEYDSDELINHGLDSMQPQNVVGIYAEKEATVATATQLLQSVSLSSETTLNNTPSETISIIPPIMPQLSSIVTDAAPPITVTHEAPQLSNDSGNEVTSNIQFNENDIQYNAFPVDGSQPVQDTCNDDASLPPEPSPESVVHTQPDESREKKMKREESHTMTQDRLKEQRRLEEVELCWQQEEERQQMLNEVRIWRKDAERRWKRKVDGRRKYEEELCWQQEKERMEMEDETRIWQKEAESLLSLEIEMNWQQQEAYIQQQEDEYRRRQEELLQKQQEKERQMLAAKQELEKQEEKRRRKKEAEARKLEAKRLKLEAKQKAKETQRIRREEAAHKKEAERKAREVEKKRLASERKNLEEKYRQREEERRRAAAEEKRRRQEESDRMRKKAEDEKKENRRLRLEVRQRKAEERRRWRDAHSGWWERRRRRREEERVREEKQRRYEEECRKKEIERKKKSERERQLADKEFLEEQKRRREREKKELIERIGLAAYQEMIDEEARIKEEETQRELEAIRAYCKACEDRRKEEAKQKAREAAVGHNYDHSTPSYARPTCDYVPPSSSSTSYQYSPLPSSYTTPQSTTTDLSYGAAQEQWTKQINNAIR